MEGKESGIWNGEFAIFQMSPVIVFLFLFVENNFTFLIYFFHLSFLM